MNGPRLPKASYKGTNGFLATLKDDHLQVATVSETTNAKQIRDAVSIHRATQDMLEIKGSYFPGLDVMAAIAETPATFDTLNAHITALDARHAEDTAALLDLQTRDHLLAQLDAHDSTPDADADPSLLPPPPDGTDADAELTLYRYLHARGRAGWAARRAQLAPPPPFPASIAQFAALGARDKVRVARYLCADGSERERVGARFGWARAVVGPLEEDYARSGVFQKEVKEYVRDEEKREAQRATAA